MDDEFGCIVMILIAVVVLVSIFGANGCFEETKPSTTEATTQPSTQPSVVIPRKITPPREVAPNIYYFESEGWPDNLAVWIAANPNKRIVGQPVFQPHWEGSTIGTYLVITEDVPKNEPNLEK